jgi:basic membrane lipoprotein Med (substrate-binding protein (PBP1-ABC) superfamily)
MATVPAAADLVSWLGTGAAITGVAASGYYIPAANVGAFIGNDSPTITNDIRDFLYSVLSLCEAKCTQQIAAADTRPTKISVAKSTDNLSNPKKIRFVVTLDAATITNPAETITLPTYG